MGELLTWTHVKSIELIWNGLQLFEIIWNNLRCGNRLKSLELHWKYVSIVWIHLKAFEIVWNLSKSVDIIWTNLKSLKITWTHEITRGKKSNLLKQEEKRESACPDVFNALPPGNPLVRTHARHQTISRLRGACMKANSLPTTSDLTTTLLTLDTNKAAGRKSAEEGRNSG